MRTAIIDPRLANHLRNFFIHRCRVYRVPLVANELGEKVAGTRELAFDVERCYFAVDDSDKGQLQEVRGATNQFNRSVHRALLDGYYPEIQESVKLAGVTYKMEADVDETTYNLIGVYALPINALTELTLEEVTTR